MLRKINYQSILKVLFLAMILTFFGCSFDAKTDFDHHKSKAEKYFLASDYEKAEQRYRKSLEIATFMGWAGTQVYTLVEIAKMEYFQKDFEGADKTFSEAVSRCKNGKECDDDTKLSMYTSLFIYTVYQKKDIQSAKKLIDEIQRDDKLFQSPDKKNELLNTFSDFLPETESASEAN